MSGLVLVLRPEPGAAATAARARRIGLEPVTAPIFSIRPLSWQPPPAGGFDAVLLTSANAARQAGPALAAFLSLPCYAVGDTTAGAAREAGFASIVAAGGGGQAAVAAMAEAGVRRALHLCGRDHLALTDPRLAIERRTVYAADAAERLPAEARDALEGGALALIHSPRAGAVFGALIDRAGVDRGEIALAAISAPAAAAAGSGWCSVAAAARPRDEALLELAGELCNSGGGGA